MNNPKLIFISEQRAFLRPLICFLFTMQYDLWNIFRKMLEADLLQIVKKRSETKVVQAFYLNRELPTVYLLKPLYFN